MTDTNGNTAMPAALRVVVPSKHHPMRPLVCNSDDGGATWCYESSFLDEWPDCFPLSEDDVTRLGLREAALAPDGPDQGGA